MRTTAASVAGGRQGTKPPARRPKSRRRLLVIIAGITAFMVTLTLGATLRPPSPVGHWTSAAGQLQFLDAYERAFRTMPTPDETIDVRTDYGLVRLYRFSGSRETEAPLMLLPGRSSGSPVWAENLPSLLEIGDVYTIDLLGEPGRSVQERPITTNADQAEWLHQTLELLPEERFHIVGLSIGGWNAVNLAVHDSGAIASLSLIDPVFVFADMPLKTVIRSLPAAFAWLPKSWRDGFNSYTAGGAPVEDVPVADMIESGMKHYALKVPQPSRITEDELQSLDVPVLAIIAENSVMHDADEAFATASSALSQGTVLLYPAASHAINGEYPDELADDIATFIAAQS